MSSSANTHVYDNYDEDRYKSAAKTEGNRQNKFPGCRWLFTPFSVIYMVRGSFTPNKQKMTEYNNYTLMPVWLVRPAPVWRILVAHFTLKKRLYKMFTE